MRRHRNQRQRTWRADVWWLIEGNQSRWTYTGGATGGIDALEAMESRLTGFDDECVVRPWVHLE